MNRSEIMSRIKSKNTKPELFFEEILRMAGVKYEKHPKGIKGHPDFMVGKTLVFVDGCFWHLCPAHCRMPKTNTEFWKTKLFANKRRDKKHDRILKKEGWNVRRIWEHDLKNGGRK